MYKAYLFAGMSTLRGLVVLEIHLASQGHSLQLLYSLSHSFPSLFNLSCSYLPLDIFLFPMSSLQCCLSHAAYTSHALFLLNASCLLLWLHTALCVALSACCVSIFALLLYSFSPLSLNFSLCLCLLLSHSSVSQGLHSQEKLSRIDLPFNYLMCSLPVPAVCKQACLEVPGGGKVVWQWGGGQMGWQQLSQRAASSETKHLPVTPALVTVCCHSWLGPSTQRMNVSIPWHQTKAVFWHVCKLLTSTYTERAVFRWKGASQEAHTSVIKGTVIM